MWIVVLQSDFHHLWASNTSLSIDFHFKVIHYSNSGEFYILSPLNSSHKLQMSVEHDFSLKALSVSCVGVKCRLSAEPVGSPSCAGLLFSSAVKSSLQPVKSATDPVMPFPPIENMNSFCFPSNHSTLLSSTASSWEHTHTHITPLALIVVWKPPSNPQPLFCSQKKRDFFLVVLASTLSVVHRVQQTHH